MGNANRSICATSPSALTQQQCCVDECHRLQTELDSREGGDPDCDPAGAIFPETLAGLELIDQECLRFSGTGNLSAVRWLLALGANGGARDRNGTTMLHAACRSGTISIVQELLRNGLQLDTPDVAGWTPLHIAAAMGRRDIAMLLLQARSNVQLKNKRGSDPLDLVSDAGTKEVFTAFATGSRLSVAAMGAMASLGSLDEHGATVEPFFVPRAPVFRHNRHIDECLELGLTIFRCSPGHGLAFLVATGSVRDHPTDLSSFLVKHRADPIALGDFLGEDFSLSQTLRLALFATVGLKGTGVVTALAKSFRHVRVPPDLRKIDRLTAAISHLWWRMHDLDEEFDAMSENSDEKEKGWDESSQPDNAAGCIGMESQECQGMDLRWCLHSAEGLRRLLFSTVLLHWNVLTQPRHSALGLPELLASRRFQESEWMLLNAGLEADGSNLPVHVQKGIFQTIKQGPLSQLFSSSTTDSMIHAKPLLSALRPQAEGWATIPAGGLERMDPLPAGSYAFPGSHNGLGHVYAISEMLSSNLAPLMPLPIFGPERTIRTEMSDQVIYMMLSSPPLFLFFATSPSDVAPYAFIRLQDADVQDADPSDRRLILAGRKREMEGEVISLDEEPLAASMSRRPFGDARMPLTVCFILADGRFQPLDALWLELQLPSEEEALAWQLRIEAPRAKPPMRVPNEERAPLGSAMSRGASRRPSPGAGLRPRGGERPSEPYWVPQVGLDTDMATPPPDAAADACVLPREMVGLDSVGLDQLTVPATPLDGLSVTSTTLGSVGPMTPLRNRSRESDLGTVCEKLAPSPRRAG